MSCKFCKDGFWNTFTTFITCVILFLLTKRVFSMIRSSRDIAWGVMGSSHNNNTMSVSTQQYLIHDHVVTATTKNKEKLNFWLTWQIIFSRKRPPLKVPTHMMTRGEAIYKTIHASSSHKTQHMHNFYAYHIMGQRGWSSRALQNRSTGR